MKNLLLILPLIVACKTTKSADCDAYGKFTHVDTFTLQPLHKHIITDSSNICIYRPKEFITIMYHDTLTRKTHENH
jgi:hypothetical protein